MLKHLGENAKIASKQLAKLSSKEKNKILLNCADHLEKNNINILKANELDIENIKNTCVKPSYIDRLILTKDRIKDMADGIRKISTLDDPTNEYISNKVLPNGLVVGQKRVPFGVIGMIYEARPNVTSDAFSICLKSGNAVILRGGKDAINSNLEIAKILKSAIKDLGYNENFIQIIEDTSRKLAIEMMKLNEYIDILIPRGSASLIQSVTKNSTIPVIETGVGNCHIYVDEYANLDMANSIVINAKISRTSVCNSLETLLINRKVHKEFLDKLLPNLFEKGVEVRGDKDIFENYKNIVLATEDDWKTEYLDLILAVKIVDTIDEAINHIEKYSTGHSESIITESYTNANIFTNEVDSSVVYVNASTRFTDGNELGFGAEIGISTQKLHSRGPMGLRELTSTKYIILGNGQIR